METGVSLSIPSSSSQSATKESLVVSDHSVRTTTTNEDLDKSNFGQIEERTNNEQESRPPNVDFSSFNVDGSVDTDVLLQKLETVSKKRKELQQMEIELRAQIIARTELIERKNSVDFQTKEQENGVSMEDGFLHETISPLQSRQPNKDEPPIDARGHDVPVHENEEVGSIEWDCSKEFTTDMVFKSREELIKWVKDTGMSVGCIIVVKKSEGKKVGRNERIEFECERSGHYRVRKKKLATNSINNPSDKLVKDTKKKTSTKKCGCRFWLKGEKLPDDDDWGIVVRCGKHNHPRENGSTFEGHAYAGRLSQEEAKIVTDMSKAGAKPRECLRILKKTNPKNASTISTIYNFKARNKICNVDIGPHTA